MGRVFVAGSINMDVVATAIRHPKVGETVAGQAVHYFPGGKGANQAVAAAKLGASTALIGRLGKDAFGQQLRTFLPAEGDVAVSQFEIPQATIGAFFKRARAAGATTILNPAPAIACGPELLDLVDILILNEPKLGFPAGPPLADTDEPARFIEAARRLPAASGKTICVTLGKRGVLALVGGEPSLIAGRAVKGV